MIKESLIKQFLLEWAEDEFWVGHLMVKKVYDYGPDLEENIAIGSIAQDEMGHCRMMLRTLTDTETEKDMDRFMYERVPGELRVSQLAEYWYDHDWVRFMMKQLIYDLVDRERLIFAEKLQVPEVQNMTNIMMREEAIHLEHWREWALLISTDYEGRQKIQEAVNELYPLVADFFAGTLYKEISETYLQDIVKPEDILLQSLQRVNEILQQLQVKPPCSEEEMLAKLQQPGGRAGKHSKQFTDLYDELTTVYRQNPQLVWG